MIFTEETSNDEEDEEEWEVGAPREVIETNIYDRSEGPERHRQFDMKQLLTEQDEDTIGEYLKKKYADSHERRYVTTCITQINCALHVYCIVCVSVCMCVCVHASLLSHSYL